MFIKKVFLCMFFVLMFSNSSAYSNNSKSNVNGNFCLLDSATQIPVLSCTIPNDWCGGGKTTWTSEPAQPVFWYVWFMSPDGLSRIAMNSSNTIMAYGAINQIEIFQRPENLGEFFLQSLAKDYALPNLELVNAVFNDSSNSQEGISVLKNYPDIGNKIGIMTVTNRILLDCELRYSGFRAGNRFNVVMGFTIFAYELRSSVAVTTMIQFFPAYSCGFVEGNENSVIAIKDSIVKTTKVNPAFTELINLIITKRTDLWLQTQKEIREIQEGVYKGSRETQEKIFSKWNEYISDVEIVRDPSTGQDIALDSRFDHARMGSDGSILYYNDGFNPNENSLEFDPNLNPSFNNITWGKDLKSK